MSLSLPYGNQTAAHIVDPVRDIKNARVEYRLTRDMVYYANMRLCNVGLVSTTTGPHLYNALVGTWGQIKQIALYDGSTLLDQQLVSPQMLGFKLYNSTNSESRDINKFLVRNNLGFHMTGQKYAGNGVQIDTYLYPARATDNAQETARGWLSLRQVFNFLGESMFVPTNVYKNLRLVIQYNTDNVQTLRGEDVVENTEPILLVDTLEDEELKMKVMKEYKGVPRYRTFEHDRVIIDAVAPTSDADEATQDVTRLVRGFDNKVVNRLLMINTPRGARPATDITGGLESVSQYNQKVQWRVNGANRLPRDGDRVNRPNQRLAMLSDTFGECNALPGSNDVSLTDSANLCVGGSAAPLVGRLDYTGLVIGERIEELQLRFQRDSVYSATAADVVQFNQQLELNLYGEVEKMVVPEGDRYNVRYA